MNVLGASAGPVEPVDPIDPVGPIAPCIATTTRSTFDTPTTKDKLFNFNTTETTTSARFGINLYNSGTGNYQGDNSIIGSYFGDWVIIKLPQPIMLTRYRIYQRTDFPTKAPSLWKCYGSNDGITIRSNGGGSRSGCRK